MKGGILLISYKAKKSILYSELDSPRKHHFFDFTQKKFMHNIDTLYYSITVKNDWKYDSNCILFKSYLASFQESALKQMELMPVFTTEQMRTDVEINLTGEWLMNGIALSPIYKHDLQKPDKYFVMIAPNLPNENTPQFIVQLRSQYLWLRGEKAAVKESLSEIEELLSQFAIEIKEVKENRIDYAYHTNYIQNPTSYFKSENLNRMQCSNFSRWSMEGNFRGQFEVEVDYVTLGRKKSNNLFFRIYDKTKEVIQQGYKQFFIQMWYLEKMISYFDLYCIEKAFLNPSADNYKYLDVARLEFYLDYGKDEIYKGIIRDLLSDQSRDYEAIIELADILTPPVTKVLNVELETKRKFYSTMDNSMAALKVSSVDPTHYSAKLFRILDNKALFHDYITCNNGVKGIIRFIDYKAKNRLGKPWADKNDFPTSDFWRRLQSIGTDWHRDDVELIREYQQNLSLTLIKKRLVNQMSTFSLYAHGEDVQNDLIHDVLDFMSTINETVLHEANEYKKKKLLQINGRLDKVEGQQKLQTKFKIVNVETGEAFKAYS